MSSSRFIKNLITDKDLLLTKRSSSNSSKNTDCTSSECSSEEPGSASKTKHQVKLERRHQNYEMKKKTELCRTFQLGMGCPYGAKCSFAHGVHEIRQKVLIPTNYKTSLCQQFYTKGYCNYGPRCQFQHRQDINTKIQENKVKIGYHQIVEGLNLAVDYKLLNDGEVDNVEWFLNQTMNLENFNLKPLAVFRKCHAF